MSKNSKDILIVIIILVGIFGYFKLRPGKLNQGGTFSQKQRKVIRSIVKVSLREALEEMEQNREETASISEKSKLTPTIPPVKSDLPPLESIDTPGYYCNKSRTLVMEYSPSNSIKAGTFKFYNSREPFNLIKKDFLTRREKLTGAPNENKEDAEPGPFVLGGYEIEGNKIILDVKMERRGETFGAGSKYILTWGGQKLLENIHIFDDGVSNKFCKDF